MGMYTEIVFKATVRKDIDKKAMQILEHLFNSGPRPDKLELPEHAFFETWRWQSIGSCSSFYHHPRSVSDWYDVEYSDSIYIFSRSDLKNYDSEIDKFFDWIMPYIDEPGGQCIGWRWYEEDEQPTLILKR